VVTIHQPEHLPWLGFFDKVRQADIFVLLDHVQFRKGYFQNRNRIRSDQGSIWLTVPVLTKGNLTQAINQVQINNQGSPRWREKCWTSIRQHYHNARYWRRYSSFLEDLYQREWNRLVELNESLIRYLLSALGIEVHIVRSSEMVVRGHQGDLLLDICRRLGTTTYLSGVSGREYLDLGLFAAAGIEVRFQEFYHPIYRQLHEPFMPCMSTIDLLMNYGPESLRVIEGIGVDKLDHVIP
jgi:hypothetical protein